MCNLHYALPMMLPKWAKLYGIVIVILNIMRV